jgi:hypothetical protein
MAPNKRVLFAFTIKHKARVVENKKIRKYESDIIHQFVISEHTLCVLQRIQPPLFTVYNGKSEVTSWEEITPGICYDELAIEALDKKGDYYSEENFYRSVLRWDGCQQYTAKFIKRALDTQEVRPTLCTREQAKPALV